MAYPTLFHGYREKRIIMWTAATAPGFFSRISHKNGPIYALKFGILRVCNRKTWPYFHLWNISRCHEKTVCPTSNVTHAEQVSAIGNLLNVCDLPNVFIEIFDTHDGLKLKRLFLKGAIIQLCGLRVTPHPKPIKYIPTRQNHCLRHLLVSITKPFTCL